MAQHDVVTKLGATEIKMSVFEPQLFGRQRLAAIARNWNRWRFRRTNETQSLSTNLDVAGRQLSVSHLLRTRDNFARDQNDTLGAESTCDLERLGARVRRIERYLHDACAIAEIDEYETAEVASAMNPSSEPNGRTNVFDSEQAAERISKCRLERRPLIHVTDSRRPCAAVDARAPTNLSVDDAFKMEVGVPVTKRAAGLGSAMKYANPRNGVSDGVISAYKTRIMYMSRCALGSRVA